MSTNLIPSTNSIASCAQPLSLEETLAELTRYGRPSLGIYSDDKNTWECGLKVRVTGTGVVFSVSSGFDNPTPLAAARLCHQRLISSLKELEK